MFITKLKIFLIKLADIINLLWDPFDSFTRPAMPKENKTLKQLETEFFQDLITNFWGCQEKVLLHRIVLDKRLGLDMGDQALWHGIYTGMLALRYRMTGEGKEYIAKCLEGLLLHQTVHGDKPRLIRGMNEDLSIWQDDASNDTLTGHLFGIYAVWKWGPIEFRDKCRKPIMYLADELLDNQHSLIKTDGTPTTYGQLESGWKTDPLRISLVMAVYTAALGICGGDRFSKAYIELKEKYEKLIRYAKVRVLWKDNPNDTHRAAIHLALLADRINNPEAFKGLERIRRITRKEANPWVMALCCWGLSNNRHADRAEVIKVLSEFILTSKMFNPGLDNYPLSKQYKDIGLKTYKWGGVFRSSQPLPRHAVRSQDFFWQRNTRSLDVGSGNLPADSRHNGGDFLCAYWLCRYLGILNESD